MDSDSIPPNSFGWEYKPRSSLRTHALHRTDSKDPDVHVLDRRMPATKTHPACTIHEDWMWLPQWLDYKRPHTQKSHPKWWTPETTPCVNLVLQFLLSPWYCKFSCQSNIADPSVSLILQILLSLWYCKFSCQSDIADPSVSHRRMDEWQQVEDEWW